MATQTDRAEAPPTGGNLLWQVMDYANRANPYPLFARMLETPVVRQDDGSYLVSTYDEILALLHDPRVSSVTEERPMASFIGMDPPEHGRLRRLTMRHFGPPHSPSRLDTMRGDLARVVAGLIDDFRGQREVDVIEGLAYPFPVTVICNLLGVPREDEPRFRKWADAVVDSEDFDPREDREKLRERLRQVFADFRQYMAELIDTIRQRPSDDMLSALASDDGPEGRMPEDRLVETGLVLLFAGHETTVNLIGNGVLTLLRHPHILERLRREPDLIVGTVEELLRYEPPVQFLPGRVAFEEITIAGTTIPKGSRITLMLAAGNRDPRRFRDPDRFDPDREDNQHLGFGSGIHICFGAPLARLETQIALGELARRVVNPRLLEDPPPYRRNPFLRGPRHLPIAIDGVRD